MSLSFWLPGVASAVLLSLSATEEARAPVGMLMVGAGVLCMPLADPLLQFCTTLTQGRYNPVLHTHIVPLLLVMLLIAVGMAGVVPRLTVPRWQASLGTWLVMAALAGGLTMFTNVPAKLGAQVLVGVLFLPLIYMGLWMGANLRPDIPPKPFAAQQGLYFALAVVVFCLVTLAGSALPALFV